MKKIFTTLILFAAVITAQQKDPDKILTFVREEFKKIEDYVVDVEIKIDVNYIKAPATKAKIYYKQPDKVKMESEGFAMLPKQGLNFSPVGLLENEYNAIYSGQDTVDENLTDVVKVIPSATDSKIVLMTMWIDTGESRVRKVETTTKKQGTYSIALSYKKDEYEVLPSKVVFTFDVPELNIPTAISGEVQEETPKPNKKNPLVGTVTVDYLDYQVNTGLADSIFTDENDEMYKTE